MVETLSGKPIFGQDGPKNNKIYYFLQQTICRKTFVIEAESTLNLSRPGNAAHVKIFCAQKVNPQVTNTLILLVSTFRLGAKGRTLVGTSEAIRLLLVLSPPLLSESPELLILSAFLAPVISPLTPAEEQVRFAQWLGGLIDGDGCFLLSKKNYASLEIVVELRDQACLHQIKNVFGGAIQLRAGDNHLRYRLHSRAGLLSLIAAVNGHIRNPVRLSQLNRICVEYGLPPVYAAPLTYRDGWMSGFFDADGSVYLNLASDQVFITISQKNKLLLDPLKALYGGEIYALRAVEAFK